MWFKVDERFLRFLTMGAMSVRHVAAELRNRGFEPIELERYCSSNKIWTTKVKRLRLPDLLCARTGLRIEVRAKSDLKIRMSDSQGNPDRAWDADLRDRDLVAFVACADGPDGPGPVGDAVYFSIEALRASEALSKLGPAKSASDGAERDRTWPATVPTRSGRVLSVDGNRLVVMMESDGRPERRQSYQLRGKHAYFGPGERFAADTTILAGAPRSLADVNRYLEDRYSPIDQLHSDSPTDRYAAAKALRFREDLFASAVPALEETLEAEREVRVALEAAGSAAALGSTRGEERLAAMLGAEETSADMIMETILILSELRSEFGREQLRRVAGDSRLPGDERRQAAVWGLGRAGLKSYEDLVPFIEDDEQDVALHAIAAFGPDTPRSAVEKLTAVLSRGDMRAAATASEALRVIGSETVLDSLVAAASADPPHSGWPIATIGRLPPEMVRKRLRGTDLLQRLEPMLLIAHDTNWLAEERSAADMKFLLKQNL